MVCGYVSVSACAYTANCFSVTLFLTTNNMKHIRLLTVYIVLSPDLLSCHIHKIVVLLFSVPNVSDYFSVIALSFW